MMSNKLSSSKRVSRKISTILSSLAVAFGFVPSAQAIAPSDLTSVETMWEYTQSMNSIDGYRAFIASHADNEAYTTEARARAIALLGDFDLGLDGVGHVPSPLLSADYSYQLVQATGAGSYTPPYGQRQLTFVDVFIDQQGRLIDETGAFIDPQGNHLKSGSCRVTANGDLVSEDGQIIAENVGVVARAANEVRPTREAIGRLSIRRVDFAATTKGAAEVSADGFVTTAATSDIATAAASDAAARDDSFSEARVSLASAGLTGVYGG